MKETRLDERQDNRWRLGRGSDANTARNSKMLWSDGPTDLPNDMARCRVAWPWLKRKKKKERKGGIVVFSPPVIPVFFKRYYLCSIHYAKKHISPIESLVKDIPLKDKTILRMIDVGGQRKWVYSETQMSYQEKVSNYPFVCYTLRG